MATKKDALGLAIAKAMDLDDNVRKVTLICEVGQPDVAVVEFVLKDLDSAEIVSEIRNYELRDVT